MYTNIRLSFRDVRGGIGGGHWPPLATVLTPLQNNFVVDIINTRTEMHIISVNGFAPQNL